MSSPLWQRLTGTGSLAPQTLLTDADVQEVITVQGARPGDFVMAMPTNSILMEALTFGPCRVTALNTVSVVFQNRTANSIIVGAAIEFSVVVWPV